MITIQYLNPSPAQMRVHGDNFGRVFLDVSSDYEVRITKALDQIDETEQISQEAALSGSLRATNKNRAVLEQFRPDAINRNTDVIQVEVLQDGDRLPLTGAAVLRFDEATNEYEFELFGDDWIDKLEALLLADVDIGIYEYTKANVVSTWTARHEIAIPGPAHYGAWNTPGDVTRQDFRFWFNLGLLMKEVFCAIGWEFESPHFDNGDGKHLIAYLPNEDEFWYEGKESPRFASATIATPQGVVGQRFGNTIVFDDLVDPNDYYNNPLHPAQYFYDTAFENLVTFRLKVENLVVELPPPPTGEPAYYLLINIVKVRNGIPSTVHQESFIGSADQTRTVTVDFEYVDEHLIGGDAYLIRMNHLNLGQAGDSYQNFTILSGNVYFRPNPGVFYPDDFIPLQNLLPSTLTGMDLFEAMAHMINGKVITDSAAQKVTLYTPYDYRNQTDTATIEGFYINEMIDLRSKTIADETSWATEEKERNRFLIYSFADSTDPYIKSDEIYKTRVDLKTGIPKETKHENPLFEPTGEILATVSEIGGTDGMKMPVLWDNEDGVLSESLGPRVANFYGYLTQGTSTWSFEGINETDFPYISMIPSVPLPTTVDFIPVTYSGFARDFYTFFYKREVESRANNTPYQLLLTGGNETYRVIDFRKTILVRDRDSDLEMTPTAVRDHLVGSRVPLLINARIV